MSNKSACIDRLGAKASTNRHGSLQQAEDTGEKIVDFLHKNAERLADEAAGEGFTEVEIPISLSNYGMPDAYFKAGTDLAFKDRLIDIVEDLIRKEFAAKWAAADAAGNNGLSFCSNTGYDRMSVRLDFSAATAEHLASLEASCVRRDFAAGAGASGVKPEVKPEMGSTDADGTIVIE
jgi:hypothetical protein